MICILTKLVLDSGEPIREAHILTIYKDRGIRELCRTGRSLFSWGSLSILSVCLEELGLEGIIL
jgi:hypothetical protein